MTKKKSKKKTIDESNKVFIIIMTIALLALLVIWIVKDANIAKDGKETPVTEKADYSIFSKTTVSSALKMAKEKTPTFIYFGYEGCEACDSFTSTLKTINDEYDIKMYYINTKSLDRNSSDWKKLTNMFTKEVKLNLKKDGVNLEQTKTIGKFLYEDGYTPTFVVVKEGKLVNGNIGKMTQESLEEFLDNAGFSKK